jgi:hypothetical protein
LEGDRLTIIVLAYSRIDNVKKTVKSFNNCLFKDLRLVILLDREHESSLSLKLSNYCKKYNVELEITGGLGHDLNYKKALIGYKNSTWKWIVNDSIILDFEILKYIRTNITNKESYDCIFLSESIGLLGHDPIWYATRTGWTILKNNFINYNFVSESSFKNFPQLSVFNKDYKFAELRAKLFVNKSTNSYWLEDFWSTWYIDFVSALYKLDYNYKTIKQTCVLHARRNGFFALISMMKWPESFYLKFSKEYYKYMSCYQILIFKIFYKLKKIYNKI